MEQRKELMYERHTLPSRFWEPEPDEEDLKRMAAETEADEDLELPFE
ncbi:MAG: hypothetical protein K6E30_09385 [Lachnospiraceae bacterium]|nr:hypothetical protein [Lachnospiraceae bacterium]